MKALVGLLAAAAVLVGGFFLLNNYIYQQKQGNPMQQNPVTVTPIEHASLALQYGAITVIADPVGDPGAYASLPRPDIVVVTHEHGDHFSTSTLQALVGNATTLITNQSVADQLPAALKNKVVVMHNGDTTEAGGVTIEAVPAYNIRQEALQYHPRGRDNGYILTLGTTRVYIAGDTEGTPEMRALTNVDIAFVPMNLPYTMPVRDAAEAVLAFKPTTVYPYHYRDSDIETFRQMVNAGDPAINVMLAQWYK